jgi:two-component system KDP operon response regulator KdpE
MGKILLVDDEPLLRRAFRTLLEATGHDVCEAGSADEAIACARSEQPSLIVLDLGLPDRPGLDVARELTRSQHSTIPILAMTGMSGGDVAADCAAAGCAGYLVKPVEPRELVRRIGALLGQPPTTAPAENRA